MAEKCSIAIDPIHAIRCFGPKKMLVSCVISRAEISAGTDQSGFEEEEKEEEERAGGTAALSGLVDDEDCGGDGCGGS